MPRAGDMPVVGIDVESVAEALARTAPADLARLVAARSQTGVAYGGRLGVERALDVVEDLVGAPGRVTWVSVPASTPGAGDYRLAILRGTGTGRLLLSGHVDCVGEPPGGLPWRVDGDRAWGRGTYDMKGGVVVLARLLGWLASRPEAYDSVFALLTADEEARRGTLRIPNQIAAPVDACLCFEGGGPEVPGVVVVERAGAGVLRCAVTGASGRAAHPGAGPNALVAAAELVGVLAASAAGHGRRGVQVVPTRLRGDEGQSVSTITATASVDVIVRWSALAETTGAVGAMVRGLPRAIAGCRVEHHLDDGHYPAMSSTAVARETLRRAERRLGRELRTEARAEGASDVNLLSRHAAMSFDGLGPSGGGDHGDNEHVRLSSFRHAYAVAAAIVVEALAMTDAELS